MKEEQRIHGNQSAAGPNVLILYDKVASGKRAKELCDRLGKELGPRDELRFSLCNLAALKVAPMAQAALAEAADVALLIVAVNGDDALSPSVKSWISRWGRVARSTGGALVAQLHGIVRMNHELSPAYACLKHIAKDERLDFYSETVHPLADETNYSLEAIHHSAQMRTSLLEAIFHAH